MFTQIDSWWKTAPEFMATTFPFCSSVSFLSVPRIFNGLFSFLLFCVFHLSSLQFLRTYSVPFRGIFRFVFPSVSFNSCSCYPASSASLASRFSCFLCVYFLILCNNVTMNGRICPWVLARDIKCILPRGQSSRSPQTAAPSSSAPITISPSAAVPRLSSTSGRTGPSLAVSSRSLCTSSSPSWPRSTSSRTRR